MSEILWVLVTKKTCICRKNYTVAIWSNRKKFQNQNFVKNAVFKQLNLQIKITFVLQSVIGALFRNNAMIIFISFLYNFVFYAYSFSKYNFHVCASLCAVSHSLLLQFQ